MPILDEIGKRMASQLLSAPDKTEAAESIANQINRLYYDNSNRLLSRSDKQILIEIITIEIVMQVDDINEVKTSHGDYSYQQLIDYIRWKILESE